MTEAAANNGLQAIGWALMHGVWLLLAAGAINALSQHLLRTSRPNARYVAACSILIAIAVVFCGIWCSIFFHLPLAFGSPVTNGLVRLVPQPAVPSTWAWALRRADAFASWIAVLWLVYVIGRVCVLVFALLRIERLLRSATPISDTDLPGRWQELRERLCPGRAIEVVDLPACSVPATVGWRRPRILLPRRLLAELTPTVIESVLAHELAHIRRKDFAVNAAQLVVSAAFWLRPVSSSISRTVRNVRDECCDDLAIAALNVSRREYGHCLLAIDAARPASPLLLGFGDGDELARFRRLGSKSRERDVPAATLKAVCMILVAFAGLSLVAQPAASFVKERQQVSIVRSEVPGETLYRLLAAECPNAAFASALERAVVLLRAKKLDARSIDGLAEIVGRGQPRGALLAASLAQCDARSLKIRKGPWQGGDGEDWDDVATAVFNDAHKSAPPRRDRLVRTALLIAAQDRLNAGGILFRLVTEPMVIDSDVLSAQAVGELRASAAVDSDLVCSAVGQINEWDSSLAPLPDQLVLLAEKRPCLQWSIAFRILQCTRGVAGGVATALSRSDPHWRLSICRALLATPAYSSSSSGSSSSKIAPKQGPALGQEYCGGAGSSTEITYLSPTVN